MHSKDLVGFSSLGVGIEGEWLLAFNPVAFRRLALTDILQEI
jgi:hypothetical protein